MARVPPPSLFSTVSASAPRQEFTGQDVVKSSEEKPGGSLRQQQGIPDGYVREDGKIWCPVIKKTSKTGKWFKAHGWVTREYFEKLVRAGRAETTGCRDHSIQISLGR